MRIISLASGSTGNALLVEAGPQRRTKVLVDAGINGRLLTNRLMQVAVHSTHLQGVLVTHEHSDHIIGLPALMKRFAIPAIADPRTLAAIEECFASGIWRTDSGSSMYRSSYFESYPALSTSNSIDEQQAGENPSLTTNEPGNLPTNGMWQGDKLRYTTPLNIGSRFVIGDIEVRSFPVSHDAVAPCGYLLKADGHCVCIAIDSGKVTPTMLKMMAQADLLIIESNHDRQRLINGPYPYSVKQRILSTKGHLSNDQAAEAILHTWQPHGVRWVWLSHLSQVNNTPELALEAMRNHIEFAGANPSQVFISASPPGMGSVWDSAQLWRTPSLWE
jgi:phosphoribosyl 1,2-cyclic phosphodiesterase